MMNKTTIYRSVFFFLTIVFVLGLHSCKKPIPGGDPTDEINIGVILDGVNDYIDVPDRDTLDLNKTFTIELWIKPDDISGNRNILGKQWCTDQFAYNLSIVDGVLRWEWNSTTGNCTSNNIFESFDPVIEANKKTHIAVVHSSSSILFYVNAKPVVGHIIEGSFGEIINSDEPLRIGAYKLDTGDIGNFFKGGIDDIRIWDYKLPQDQIQISKQVAITGDEYGLIASYNMENTPDGQSQIVINICSGTGNDLNGITRGTSTTPIFDEF